jgi:hypothetical protein
MFAIDNDVVAASRNHEFNQLRRAGDFLQEWTDKRSTTGEHCT